MLGKPLHIEKDKLLEFIGIEKATQNNVYKLILEKDRNTSISLELHNCRRVSNVELITGEVISVGYIC